MDAERLEAIRQDAAPNRSTLYYSHTSRVLVRELLDHIDALQAENERLRQEAINARRARIVSLREQNQALQARVTLLEGLRVAAEKMQAGYAGARSSIDHPGWWIIEYYSKAATNPLCDVLLAISDAALSRSTIEP